MKYLHNRNSRSKRRKIEKLLFLRIILIEKEKEVKYFFSKITNRYMNWKGYYQAKIDRGGVMLQASIIC